MSAGEQDPQRGKRETSHAASVAQKLLLGLALACSCDDGTTAPPVDPDDLDGDGIPNARDLCPGVQDPAQHDEDGDGFGDLCDVCPTVADPLQTDQGELDTMIAFQDGVGDACDPRPSRGGDKIGALHTFATDTTPSWLGAGWTIAGDRARASGAAQWQHVRPVPGDSITARLAVESVVWGTAGGAVAVAVDGDASGRSCALVADRNADGNDELEVREPGGATLVRELAGAVAGPFQIFVQRGVDRRTGTGILHCRFIYPDRPDHETTATIATSDDATTGQYAFSAAGADVVVTSLIVYSSPIACPSVTAVACDLP
jgi:thrombospondin type 3 repeat protein